MKLVAISRVKNELDIIEAFVSHHVQHFDKLIVLDDGSSDGTYQMLQQLRPIYRELVVLNQPTVGYLKHQCMTLLLRMAVDKFGADWVAPLDADEFIEPADGLALAQVLARRRPTIHTLGLSNFVWSPDLNESDEQNPVLRQRFRLPPRLDLTKLLVHAQFVSGTAAFDRDGYFIPDSGRAIHTRPLDRVQLCHYPIRSIAQYASKIAVGYLQYLATPDWDRVNGFHYIKPFQELAEFGLDGFANLMRQESLFYVVDQSERAKDNPQPIEAPLNYLGGPLTSKRSDAAVVSNVLRYAEVMATEFAFKVKKSQDFDRISTEITFLRKQVLELERELVNSQEKVEHQAQRISQFERELFNSREKVEHQAQQLSVLERVLSSHEKLERQGQQLSQLERELLDLQEKMKHQGRQLLERDTELLDSREKIARQQQQLQSRTYRLLTRVHGMLIHSKILRQRP